MSRTPFNTASDPGPIVAQIEKQKSKLLKRHGRPATRLYIGTDEYKSLIRESHLWRTAKDENGAAIAVLMDLTVFKVVMPTHCHVSYNKRDVIRD